MKKIFLLIIGLLLMFIILIYISLSSTDKKFETCELVGMESLEKIDFKKYKSVRVTASNLYESNPLKSLIQGDNYREAWSSPVIVPILYLDTLFGGVKILKEGGGKQTHSLKLKAKDGVEYTLRSINKNPKPLIPDFAKSLGLENIIVDGISAQHPYAALAVAKLAEKAGVLHTSPKVVFVPEQQLLGDYNKKYGNRLYNLEHETEGKVNWTPLKNVIELMDTEDLQEYKLKKGEAVTIDKHALIKARLFDLLIGDWDRHVKQWGWALQKQDTSYVAIPIPGDRDNAFFTIDGLLPSIISNKNIEEKLRPFEHDIDYIDGLVYDFDVYFLQQTHDYMYTEQAAELQNSLTDKVLLESLQVWNKELFELYGEEILEKLISRRDNLQEIALEFKKALDKKPLLTKTLNDSDKDLPLNMIQCFEC